MKFLKFLMLLMMSCLIAWPSQCQTKPNKNLNSYERVQALYKINEQRKFLREQLRQCNKEADRCQRAIDSITQIAIDMGAESKEFSSHNLDLQEGLLGSLKKQEALEAKLVKLQASKRKRFSIGCSVGWDLIPDPKIFGGPSFNFNLLSF